MTNDVLHEVSGTYSDVFTTESTQERKSYLPKIRIKQSSSRIFLQILSYSKCQCQNLGFKVTWIKLLK